LKLSGCHAFRGRQPKFLKKETGLYTRLRGQFQQTARVKSLYVGPDELLPERPETGFFGSNEIFHPESMAGTGFQIALFGIFAHEISVID
jgi:hypothetical protein